MYAFLTLLLQEEAKIQAGLSPPAPSAMTTCLLWQKVAGVTIAVGFVAAFEVGGESYRREILGNPWLHKPCHC